MQRQLKLTGTRCGCGVGQCGACTVHIDGKPNYACLNPIKDLAGCSVTTIEGLSPASAHPLQKAWVAEQVRNAATASRDRSCVPRQQDLPRMHIKLVQTRNHPTGAGQMATPLVPSAISNALFQLTGVRLRQQPLLPERVKLALQEGATKNV